MPAKPIIFSAPMVRALLEGRKTQTRRVINPPKKYPECNICQPDLAFFGYQVWFHGEYETVGVMVDARYNPSDLLWVKETWRTLQKWDCLAPRHLADDADKIDYAASGYTRNPLWVWGKNRPSIFMTRWASRITLRITNVRAERLHDISEQDARAEGANFHDGDPDSYGMCRRLRVDAKDDFRHIWEDCYHKDSPEAWHRNPWVWVYEFEVIRENVETVSA